VKAFLFLSYHGDCVALIAVGSMSGSKIRSAIENVQNIFQNHIQGHDSIMVMTFNGNVNTDIPMSLKSGKEQRIANKIATLIRPSGGTGECC